jgi:3-oxoacyl-[acyl-carrier-protein] synthase-1
LTPANSNGFIPGEAGTAVLLGIPPTGRNGILKVSGVGFGTEMATIESEEPLRADGLVHAVKEALTDSGLKMEDLNFRITDISGEQYSFKEAALTLTRILRERKGEFDIWHPADCIGEVGAAIGPVISIILDTSMRKGYSLGNKILGNFGTDNGQRAALTMLY